MTTRTRSGAVARKNYRAIAGLTRKPRVSKTAAKVVKKIVKKTLDKQQEHKFASSNNTQTFNQTISSPSECYACVPSIPVGAQDYQRIGSKIKGTYLIIKGMVQLDGDFLKSNTYMPPSTVRIMVLSQKNLKLATDVSTKAQVGQLLKENNVGSPSARSYSGGLFDNLAHINKELFRVHMDKKIRFNWIDAQSYTGAAPDVTWQTGNDKTKYFICKIKIGKTLSYDDGNGNFPNNFSPFICMGGVNDDGTSPFTVGTPYRLTYQQTLYFTDA